MLHASLWHGGVKVGLLELMIKNSWVCLSAMPLSCNDSEQVVDTFASQRCNLVTPEGCLCSVWLGK